jgi:hypothetical protein
MINTWNKGIRIKFITDYTHGDNAGSLHAGNAIFTKGTDDVES